MIEHEQMHNQSEQENAVESRMVLAKAVLNASNKLGLSLDELNEVIGVESDFTETGIEPETSQAEASLVLITIYNKLFMLVGRNDADVAHWMRTENEMTGGIPAEQIKEDSGLQRISNILNGLVAH